jgi:hypothetical protein
MHTLLRVKPKRPAVNESRRASKPLSLASALDQSTPLAALMARVRDSQARFDAISPLIPAAMRPDVRPGPLDDKGWSLLAASNAAAAKLRQIVPQFEERLLQRGWQATPIRIRVQSG